METRTQKRRRRHLRKRGAASAEKPDASAEDRDAEEHRDDDSRDDDSRSEQALLEEKDKEINKLQEKVVALNLAFAGLQADLEGETRRSAQLTEELERERISGRARQGLQELHSITTRLDVASAESSRRQDEIVSIKEKLGQEVDTLKTEIYQMRADKDKDDTESTILIKLLHTELDKYKQQAAQLQADLERKESADVKTIMLRLLNYVKDTILFRSLRPRSPPLPLPLPLEHQPSVTSDPTQPKDGRVLSEDAEFTELMRVAPDWGAPRGLENLGQTCYFNAALQCLFRTTPLQNFVRKKKPSGMGWVSIFYQLSCEAHDNTRCRGAFAPRLLADRVSQLCQRFRLGRQEDSQEFVNCLLEAMHDEQLVELGRGEKEDPLVAATSPLRRIMGGFFRSRVEWRSEDELRSWSQPGAKRIGPHFNLRAPTHSDAFDAFTSLSLEIEGTNSLIGALQHFTAVEQLNSNNRYRTPQGALVCATRRLTVCRPPRILVVQLKRFVKDIFGGNLKKLSQHVDFGEKLDLRPFCSYQGDHQYRLYGVVVHQGITMASGHYCAYVRSSGGKWFCCDDPTVSEVHYDEVKKAQAYLLFFERTDCTPPERTDCTPPERTDCTPPERTDCTPPVKRRRAC